MILLLSGCLRTLENETTATRRQVEATNDKLQNTKVSQKLFGALDWLYHGKDVAIRERGAAGIFGDEEIAPLDQIHAFIGVLLPVTEASISDNPRIANVVTIGTEPDPVTFLRPIHEDTYKILRTVTLRMVKALKKESAKPGAKEAELRTLTTRMVYIGTAVLGARTQKTRQFYGQTATEDPEKVFRVALAKDLLDLVAGLRLPNRVESDLKNFIDVRLALSPSDLK